MRNYVGFLQIGSHIPVATTQLHARTGNLSVAIIDYYTYKITLKHILAIAT